MKKAYLVVAVWIIGLVILTSKLSAQTLTISFPQDTVYACLNSFVSLTAMPAGGTAPFLYQWGDGQSGDTIDFFVQQNAEWLTLEITDSTGTQVVDSVFLVSYTECVWPGDADGSGLADNLDLLVVGQHFNVHGPKRPNAHSNWIGQTAPAWNISLPGGVDAVHSDTDGDGVVHWSDALAIEANYVQPQTQSKSPSLQGGIPVYLDFPSGPFNPGDTVVGEIIVGDANHPAMGIIGMALSIQYDTSMISSGSLSINYNQSWLGTEGVDMATISKNFVSDAQLDLAFSRTDQVAKSGYGSVGNIIVAIDDITGKRSELLQMKLRIENVNLLGETGTYQAVNTEIVPFEIALSVDELVKNGQVKIGPVPALDYLFLEKNADFSHPIDISLNNIAGQTVLQQTWIFDDQKKLSVENIPVGLYTLTLKNKSQFFTQKIIIE
jgi:hypothetical protein